MNFTYSHLTVLLPQANTNSIETRLCHDHDNTVHLLQYPGLVNLQMHFSGETTHSGLYLKATAENGCLHCFGWPRGQSNFSPNSKNGQRTKANLSSDIMKPQELHVLEQNLTLLWFRAARDAIYVAVVVKFNESWQSIKSK